jgi:putative hydrolase of the HAD superfamily
LKSTEALIFDLDETLLYEEESVRNAFNKTCELAEEIYKISPQALTASVRKRASELWRTFPTYPLCMNIGISSWEGLAANFEGESEPLPTLRELAPGYRHACWTRALLDHGIRDEELVENLSEHFESERPKHHVPFPETEEVLSQLKRDFILAILTNGPPHHQREKLSESGLAHYFEVVVASGDIGIGKPSPEIFEHTLRVLKLNSIDAIMIGDSFERDIVGAHNAGMTSIWINSEGKNLDHEITPDFEICNLKELIFMLQ